MPPVPISELGFSLRTSRLLAEIHVHTWEELVQLKEAELEKLPGFTPIVMNEIRGKLGRRGHGCLPSDKRK